MATAQAHLTDYSDITPIHQLWGEKLQAVPHVIWEPHQIKLELSAYLYQLDSFRKVHS